jgi:hypothetical protein
MSCRLSSSDGKYQVIKTPIDTKESKAAQSYLGRLGKDVYYANVHDQIRIWTLSESSGQVDWVAKNAIGLEPMANIASLRPMEISRSWILDDDRFLDEYGNNAKLAWKDFDWDSDEDNILDTSNESGHHRGYFQLIGFHPYKEVVFLLAKRFEVVAYDWNSSKVHYIGYLRPRCDSWTLQVDEAFLYTPCMIGDLTENVED